MNWLSSALFVSALEMSACSGARMDLDRIRERYEANEFEKALALSRAAEAEVPTLSAEERARYGYYRGMTDYRLAGLATQGTGIGNPKEAYRSHARHWLGLAWAAERAEPGSLTREQAERIEKVLQDLNTDVFGGAPAKASNADAEAPIAGRPTDKPSEDSQEATPASSASSGKPR